MRRYGKSNSNTVVVKGRDSGMKFGLTPITAPTETVIPCKASPSGLYWYDDETGKYNELAQVGLLEKYSDNIPQIPDFTLTVPTFHWKAQLQGELCLCSGHTVEWRVEWSGTYPPGYDTSDKGEIFVYPRDDNKDEAGVLTIVAVLKKSKETIYVSNEIYLVITSASYYFYCSGGGAGGVTNIGGWLRVPDNYPYTSANGSMQWYGGLDGSIGAYSNNTLTLTFNNIPFTQLWVYSNDGGSGYYKVNGGSSRYFNRGAFYPPWNGGTPISISGLSSIELHTDGYGSPIYLFGK